MPVNISIQYEREDNNKHVTSKHKSMNFYDEPCFFCVKMFDRHYYYFLFCSQERKLSFLLLLFSVFIQRRINVILSQNEKGKLLSECILFIEYNICDYSN